MVWKIIIAALALIGLCLALYVRLAPAAQADWHRLPDNRAAHGFDNGLVALVPTQDPEAFAKLIGVALDAPRTRLVFGARGEKMLTFESRSKWIGFPDYTTIAMVNDGILIYARARYGRLDFGVNAARVAQWLADAGY